jgi:tetratricopeptide (TPR) repeat protein
VKPGSETIEGGDAPEEKKPPSSDDSIAAAATAASAVEASGTSDNDTEDETEKENDAELALEMMATCYGILDQYSDSARTGDSPDSPDADFGGWVEEQLPRVLTGIGDALSHLKRHADAADAYLQALALRLAALDRLDVKGLDSVLSESMSTGAPLPPHRQSELIDLLICRRKVVESNVLVAEELLAHLEEEGVGRDVVTSETKAVLVPAGEQADYARGYYESSREQLQEAVMLVGPLKAKLPHNDTLEEERENVCFAATLVMGVGEALAALDEKAGAQQPASKRLKT